MTLHYRLKSEREFIPIPAMIRLNKPLSPVLEREPVPAPRLSNQSLIKPYTLSGMWCLSKCVPSLSPFNPFGKGDESNISYVCTAASDVASSSSVCERWFIMSEDGNCLTARLEL